MGLMKGDRGRRKLLRKQIRDHLSCQQTGSGSKRQFVHTLGVWPLDYPIRRWFGLLHLVVSGNKNTKRKWTQFYHIKNPLGTEKGLSLVKGQLY